MRSRGQLIPLHGGDPIPLSQDQLTIGRSADCDIVVRHRSISPRHCQLELRDGTWFVQDLDSHNGIRIDGARCQAGPLASGSTLRVGAARFELRFGPHRPESSDALKPEAATPEKPETSKPAGRRPPRTAASQSSRPMKRFRGKLTPTAGGDAIPLLDEVILVGRSRDCVIRLKHASVSSQHCRLEFQHGHWCVRDLGSKNGIRVNGQRVYESWLMPGDSFRVAKLRFEIDYQPQGDEPPPDLNPLEGGSLLEKAGLTRELQRNQNPDWLQSDQDPEPEQRIDLETL